MKKEFDFFDYSLLELEYFIHKSLSVKRKKIFFAANEHLIRLNKDFNTDERFLEQFVIINNHLTLLMNELYDKMLIIKCFLNNSINDESYSVIGRFGTETRAVEYERGGVYIDRCLAAVSKRKIHTDRVRLLANKAGVKDKYGLLLH